MIKQDLSVELSHQEKQIILYSKNHFEKTNTLEDIRLILGPLFGIKPKDVSPHGVYSYVVRLFLKLEEAGYVTNIAYFLENLFKTASDKIDYIAMMDKMMVEMSIAQASGMNLGEPDYSLIRKPKNKFEKLEDEGMEYHNTPMESIRMLDVAHSQIVKTIQQNYDNEFISKDEYHKLLELLKIETGVFDKFNEEVLSLKQKALSTDDKDVAIAVLENKIDDAFDRKKLSDKEYSTLMNTLFDE